MEITANAIQTVNSGSNVQFMETPVPGNCSIVHREGSGVVTLRGLTQQCRARYRISFNGNVAIPASTNVGAISVAITAGGEPLGPATMIVTPTDVQRYFNIASIVYIDVPAGCCTQIGVKNLTTTPVNFENSNLIIERVA